MMRASSQIDASSTMVAKTGTTVIVEIITPQITPIWISKATMVEEAL